MVCIPAVQICGLFPTFRSRSRTQMMEWHLLKTKAERSGAKKKNWFIISRNVDAIFQLETFGRDHWLHLFLSIISNALTLLFFIHFTDHSNLLAKLVKETSKITKKRRDFRTPGVRSAKSHRKTIQDRAIGTAKVPNFP